MNGNSDDDIRYNWIRKVTGEVEQERQISRN